VKITKEKVQREKKYSEQISINETLPPSLTHATTIPFRLDFCILDGVIYDFVS